MTQMYRTWDRMDKDRREAIPKSAEQVLAQLDQGDVV